MLAKPRCCSFLQLVKDSGPKGLTMLLNLKRRIYKDFGTWTVIYALLYYFTLSNKLEDFSCKGESFASLLTR